MLSRTAVDVTQKRSLNFGFGAKGAFGSCAPESGAIYQPGISISPARSSYSL